MRRVGFSTLSPTVGDGLNNSSTTSKNGLLGKKKSPKKKSNDAYTLRFEIVLSQDSSTNDNCAEFSYREMLKDAEEKNQLPDDPESVYERMEEAKMKEMAKRFEAKYAPKKKRRDDYIDKGAGYDENDSFIDNDEAYDELIPSTLTTKYGGFYINCGKLEFRQCSDNEDDEMISENGDDDSKDFRMASKKRKNKSNSLNIKRQKKVIESEDSKSNDNSRDLDDEEEDESESDEESSDDADSSDDQQQQNVKQVQKKKSNNSKPVDPNQQIASIIDSVINTEFDTTKDDPHKISDDLPNGLRDKLNQLREMKLNQQDKKQRFFSEDVNKILLNIDFLLQSNGSSKNKVIAWLTSYLQVSRETLLKRIKSSKRTNEESKLKKNVSNLRAEVSYVIVEHEEQFEAKRNKWDEDRKRGLDVTEPVREFKFNDKIKDLLKKILSSKRILVELDNIKGKPEEDNITNFFNNEIKNIWPTNWVSNKILLRTAGFISKFNNQSSESNKSSISVINNKKTQSSSNNNQPSNIPKAQSTNSNTNSHNSSKVKQTQQQPKDLSMERSSGKQEMNNKSDSESLLVKRPNESQSKPNNQSISSSKHHSKLSDVQSFIKQEINKHYKNDDNLQQQYSIDKLAKLDQLNESANNNLNNFNLIQQQISQQMLKEQQQKQKKLQQQLAQQQFANQQQKLSQSKNTSYDSPQNLTNLVSAHSQHNSSLSLNNSVIRPHSSSMPSPSNNLSNKKFFEQQIQQQKLLAHQALNNHTGVKASTSKQSINKSPLEVEYKIEKAIQKSFIEDSNKQAKQYQRSNSFSNNNNMNQPQNKQPTLTPKPAHSNNSTPSHSQSHPQNTNINLFNHPQLIQQLAMKQLMNKFPNPDEALKWYLQQSGTLVSGHERKSTGDLNSSTSSSLNNSFNYGNYTGNNSTNQLQSQQQSQISQAYVSNSSNVSNVASVPVTTNNLVSSTTPMNYKVQQQQQINSPIPEMKIKNEFDVNSIMSNRYSSPNQLNTAGNLSQMSYQNQELASHSMGNHVISGGSVMQQQVKPIYSDYVNNLSSQQQQQLYQRTIQQRQDDSKRK